jgi:hypothetical protein
MTSISYREEYIHNQDTSTTTIHGRKVRLYPISSPNAPSNVNHTDWFNVKFKRFIDYKFNLKLCRLNLEVQEHLRNNAYMYKYPPNEIEPLEGVPDVTHLSVFPSSAVPKREINTLRASRAADSAELGSVAVDKKVPLEIALHQDTLIVPNDVLQSMKSNFNAEHKGN